MSITIPSAPHIITPDQLIFRAMGSSPLNEMLENTNYLYATHSPALLTGCPHNDASGTAFECIFPMPASADGLSYAFLVHTWTSTTATVTVRAYAQATVSTGSWGTAVASGSASRTGHEWHAISGTVPAGTGFGRVTVSTSTGTVQVHAITVYPVTVGSLTAGAYASGFVAYDSAALDTSDGAIHTEYLNRIAGNTRAVLRDRRQCVFSWLDDSAAAKHRFSSTTAAVHILGFSGAHVAGQAGAQVTVRCRAQHTTGSGSTITFGELGGDSVSLDVDNTDNTAVLTLRSDQPMFQAALLLNGTASAEVLYLTADWRPGD